MPASIGVNMRVTGHCNQGGRKYMEDFFSVAYQQSLSDERDLEYAFIGIYDGHGGSEAATFAKEHLINLIVNQKQFWSNDDREVLRAIREGYIATHYAMWREQEKWPKTATGLPSTAGTTASIAFIRHGKIYIGHVGDSGIVLGYQEDGEKHWRARQLTQDHKPECHIEKARIMNSGGKVVTKSGVPRVVWNRPRLGHKGPVRRSTPIDEIPFLAVARSLGDLWSYNSALNEFVVSPDPDVRVVKIDPKRFRCLIFGTDGLWNVLSAQNAVDNVRMSELMNERNMYVGGVREWTNPSKNLVDRALERWSSRKMRADNTSVVIIMLDPPGPPKRDVLKACPSTQAYAMDVMPPANSFGDDGDDDEPNDGHKDSENFTVFDHSIQRHIELEDVPMPTSGVTMMTRFEHKSHSEFVADKTSVYGHDGESIDDTAQGQHSATDVPYMNSFAESYNHLLCSSMDADNSYIFNSVNETHDDIDDYDDDSGDGSNHFAGMNATNQETTNDTYSLTRLQTRSELQQSVVSMYGKPMPSTSFGSYIGHGYLNQVTPTQQLPSMSAHFAPLPTSYGEMYSTPMDTDDTVLQNLNSSSYYDSEKLLINPNVNDITIISNASSESDYVTPETSFDYSPEPVPSTSSAAMVERTVDISIEPLVDQSIQIHEISSSDSNNSFADKTIDDESMTESKIEEKEEKPTIETASVIKPLSIDVTCERIVTRSSQVQAVTSPRVTRSTDRKPIAKQSEKKRRHVALKAKIDAIIQKRATTNNLMTTKFHKENVSIVRKLRKATSVDANVSTSPIDSIASTVRTRTRAPTTTNGIATSTMCTMTTTTQRMLRSQNLTKNDVTAATEPTTTSKTKTNQSQAVNRNLSSSTSNCNPNLAKKQPKRLTDAVQIVKNDSKSNVQQLLNTRQLREATIAASATLRCKMMLAKKSISVLPNRCNGSIFGDVDRTMITRRTRLHH